MADQTATQCLRSRFEVEFCSTWPRDTPQKQKGSCRLGAAAEAHCACALCGRSAPTQMSLGSSDVFYWTLSLTADTRAWTNSNFVFSGLLPIQIVCTWAAERDEVCQSDCPCNIWQATDFLQKDHYEP